MFYSSLQKGLFIFIFNNFWKKVYLHFTNGQVEYTVPYLRTTYN